MEAPKKTGDKSLYKFITKCLFNGWDVSVPVGDCTRYDCVIDRGNALERVQVKTGRYDESKGCVIFPVASTNHYVRDGEVIHAKRSTYKGQIDFFGVYCFELDKCYLVPVDSVGVSYAFLRINDVKNSQEKKIRFAKDFEI